MWIIDFLYLKYECNVYHRKRCYLHCYEHCRIKDITGSWIPISLLNSEMRRFNQKLFLQFTLNWEVFRLSRWEKTLSSVPGDWEIRILLSDSNSNKFPLKIVAPIFSHTLLLKNSQRMLIFNWCILSVRHKIVFLKTKHHRVKSDRKYPGWVQGEHVVAKYHIRKWGNINFSCFKEIVAAINITHWK